jgi:hypothetical protein
MRGSPWRMINLSMIVKRKIAMSGHNQSWIITRALPLLPEPQSTTSIGMVTRKSHHGLHTIVITKNLAIILQHFEVLKVELQSCMV